MVAAENPAPDPELTAMEIRIFGRVQGVWFRDSARGRALDLGLHGFVRNEPDGSVFLHAEGDRGALKQLVEWCREGPPLAEVERVVQREASLKQEKEFRIVF